MSLLQAIQKGVQDINSKVTDLDHKIDLQNVKLFGSEDSETPGGRLIRLESQIAITDRRIDEVNKRTNDIETKTVRNSVLLSVFSAGIAVAFTLIGQWVSHGHI